jgi:hypothetical protein
MILNQKATLPGSAPAPRMTWVMSVASMAWLETVATSAA